MAFNTKYSPRERTITESGSRFAPVFSLKSSDIGVIDLEITGQKDLYQEIQSHADSVDIKTIMLKYQNGDENALSKANGQFVDISELPSTFAEIMQTVINETNKFNEFPLEIRKEYNFSASEYIADIGSEKWQALFIPKVEKVESEASEAAVKEVITNE